MSLRSLAEHYRRSDKATDVARQRLYRAIREAHAKGAGYGAIAKEVGLTRSGVQKIVKGS